MAEDKKRPVLKTGTVNKAKTKESPVTTPKGPRKSASEMNKEKFGDQKSEKLGKGMASGIAHAMQSTTWARSQKKGK